MSVAKQTLAIDHCYSGLVIVVIAATAMSFFYLKFIHFDFYIFHILNKIIIEMFKLEGDTWKESMCRSIVICKSVYFYKVLLVVGSKQ